MKITIMEFTDKDIKKEVREEIKSAAKYGGCTYKALPITKEKMKKAEKILKKGLHSALEQSDRWADAWLEAIGLFVEEVE